MAAKLLGTAYVYGVDEGPVPMPTTAAVSAFSTSKSYSNTQTVMSKVGNVIAKRMDDTRVTGTITLNYKTAYAPIALGATILFDGITYSITGLNDSHTNNGYRELTYNIELKQYVTPA